MGDVKCAAQRVLMRGSFSAVLTLYLTEKLMLDKGVATDWYHEFVALCYATPLLGAIIADVFLGKFL